MAVKRNLITDNTYLAIFHIALIGVDPRIIHVRQHFRLEVVFNQVAGGQCRVQRHVFVIAQLTVLLKLNNLAFVFKRTVQRLSSFFQHLLHHRLGIRVFGGDSVDKLLVLFRIQLHACRFDGPFQSQLELVEVIAHQRFATRLHTQSRLNLLSFFHQGALRQPQFAVEQVFNLLLFQLGKFGFDDGARFGFQSGEITISVILPLGRELVIQAFHRRVKRLWCKAQGRNRLIRPLSG